MNKNNHPNKKLERAEIVARFGCGFIFGIFLAIAGGLLAAPQTTLGLILVILLFAIASGFLSVFLGESFWLKFWKWFF
ncbi:MAG: hypothetical protein ACFB02_02430 [Mastigocoleus sp.]